MTTLAEQAAADIARRTGHDRHDVAIVLGSGWGPAVAAIGEGIDLPLGSVPGFPEPTAPGHDGAVRSARIGDKQALIFRGRLHLYEGHTPELVAHEVRTAAAAGCSAVILTNAAGSVRADWPVGHPVLIADHINLTGRSPLVGANFIDVTDLYTPRLRSLARDLAPGIAEGVYVGFWGPQFETPAEVRMAGILGGDLVGMSTVLEAIAARERRMDVLGISLVTNLAAGVADHPLSGDDVIAAAREAAPRIGDLVRRIVEAM